MLEPNHGQKMSGGKIIAQVLQNHGVKQLFTLSGGHIAPIFVEAENLGIRVIDTRHEVNTVFAADAVSRLSGIPGVAVVTAGPGVTNAITAVKNAYLAQSPLVLLGGGAATVLKGRGSLQDINQTKIMKPNVKWQGRITRVKDIPKILNKAFRVSQSGVPGPVFVECPIDTLYSEDFIKGWYGVQSGSISKNKVVSKVVAWYVNRHLNKLFGGSKNVDINDGFAKPTYPKHSSIDIAKALTRINKAAKPVMLIGSGAMMDARKADSLAAAVEKIGIPVYLSGMGRGLLGKNSALQMRHKRTEALKQADLIILAGVPNDFRLNYGTHIGATDFISINRSKTDLFKNKRPNLAIHADPQEFLIDLSKHNVNKCADWINTLNENDQKREDNINEQAAAEVDSINPIKLFREMDKLLDDNTILVADGGDFVATSAYTLKARAPLSWLDPGVFGTLGVGAGFAIGAKAVFPDKDVFIIYGDGSAGFSLMEYDTMMRHNLPVVSVIGNDAGWTQIARDQVEFLNSTCASVLEHSNYELVGKAFGAEGVRVENIEDFTASLKDAIEKSRNGKAYIINAIIGKTDFRKGSLSV